MPHETNHHTVSPERTTPAGVNLKLSEQKLVIHWADGHCSRFELAFLRGHCPCAACRTERENRKKPLRRELPILSHKPIDNLRVVDANLCGNYALKLVWSDGHDTGIYDFQYLRSLDANG